MIEIEGLFFLCYFQLEGGVFRSPSPATPPKASMNNSDFQAGNGYNKMILRQQPTQGDDGG